MGKRVRTASTASTTASTTATASRRNESGRGDENAQRGVGENARARSEICKFVLREAYAKYRLGTSCRSR